MSVVGSRFSLWTVGFFFVQKRETSESANTRDNNSQAARSPWKLVGEILTLHSEI